MQHFPPKYNFLKKMKINKLRIGLLLDSYEVQAWKYRAIERIANSNFAEIILVILKDFPPIDSLEKSLSLHKKQGSYAYQIMDSFDQKLFVRGPKANNLRNISGLLESSQLINAKAVQDGNFDIICSEVIQEVQSAQVDILVKLGFNNLKGDLLSIPKFGVWAYRFGNEEQEDEMFAGYWEVIKEKPVTEAILFTLNPEGQVGKILYRSQLSTYKLSPSRNRNAILWFASSYLVRQMSLLYRVGGDRFSLEISKLGVEKEDRNKNTFQYPSSWNVLTGFLKILGKIIHELFLRVFFQDSWHLLFENHPNSGFDINKFKKITAPIDRFWADPSVILNENKVYIFVEEYFYKHQKGIISVIECDQQGNRKESVPILIKNHHLSYPFVFQDNNIFYMIPESSSNRSIDLYECEQFPDKWKYKMTLMKEVNAVDTTIFFYKSKWWLFTGIRENVGAYKDVELFLFYSDKLLSSMWMPHPLNPVVSDVTRSRPAGGIFNQNGKLYRPSQDCTHIYGHKINLNEIISLSETEYEEKIATIIRPDWDPKILATHTFSHNGQITVIDAYSRRSKLIH
jgi:hypothetical protein